MNQTTEQIQITTLTEEIRELKRKFDDFLKTLGDIPTRVKTLEENRIEDRLSFNEKFQKLETAIGENTQFRIAQSSQQRLIVGILSIAGLQGLAIVVYILTQLGAKL